MGQRLCIEIKNDGMSLAVAYYHWSAYTDSALTLVEKALEFACEYDADEFPDDRVFAVMMLQETGAGLNYETNRYYAMTDYSDMLSYGEDFEFQKFIDRDSGFISVLKKTIEETLVYAEGYVCIDITNKSVNFEVLWEMNKQELDEFIEENNYDSDISKLDFDPHDIPFEKFWDFKKSIFKAEDKGGVFQDINSRFYANIA